MSVLLTDKEIDNLTPTKKEVLELRNELTLDEVLHWESMTEQERVLTALSILTNRRTAQAQLKKVVKWGYESCPHAKIFTTKIGVPYSTKYKRECSECWQALLKEVE